MDTPLGRFRVLVACMPKSGSTFLTSSIAALPGFSQVSLVPTYGHREQELCVRALTQCEHDIGDESFVAQHHVRYSAATDLYINEFRLRPILLLRNIFDVVPSLVDHHSLEGNVYPAAFAPHDIATRSFEDQANFVTQMAIPWYFNFYASWQQYTGKHVVYYEDLVSNPECVMRRVCDHLGLKASDDSIASAVSQANAIGKRKNQICPGRGKRLSHANKCKIIEMANHYPDIDFTDIGITNQMRRELSLASGSSFT
ncbi:sulfotransferase domain-containing protein [Paraburkholderia xenovorans]|uniref:sulfotransferase domain-containing protein n=1 Tax=Paraburkholderia xenovorans TaxID=36873 RepID=UPI0038B8FD83